MKKYFTCILLLVLFIMSACNNKNVDKKKIIEINISEALENKKDLHLSELVEDVEILKLESHKDCFMQAPSWMLAFVYNLLHCG